MKVLRAQNIKTTANTFIIEKSGFNYVWLVDIGNFNKVSQYLPSNKYVKGLFVTHAHYDHIYHINQFAKKYPEAKIFASENAIKHMASPKLNLSQYYDNPISFQSPNCITLKQNDTVQLFDDDAIKTIETPGHNIDCLTFIVNNYIFTGDSYIPNIKVVTKLRGGNKQDSEISLNKIKSIITNNTFICPGHGYIIKNNNNITNTDI